MLSIGNTLIFGDSYSTFAGCIPAGNATWYDTAEEHDEAHTTDVNAVEQTWWYGLLQETDSVLLRNESWSGSTVCNTGYDGADFSGWSFIDRFDRLARDGFFEQDTVDTLLLFGGTNDSSANSPVGELQYDGWTKEQLYCALPAFCYLLSRMKAVLPNTRIIWLLNTDLRMEIEEGILAACQHYGVESLCLRDIDKITGHPSIAGMKQIKEQVLSYLRQAAVP